jgi:hypothetical protein
MNPIVDGAFVQASSKIDMMAIAVGRVEKLKSEIKEISPFQSACIKEFAELVIPDEVANTFDLELFEHIWDKQTASTQRELLDMASTYPALSKVVHAFKKKEAAQKPSEQRMIAPINAVNRLIGCMIAYPLARHFKEYTDCGKPGCWGGRETPFFSSGMTPKETAQTVTQIAKKSKNITASDGKRMDGTRNMISLVLDRAVTFRAFRTIWHGLAEDQFRDTAKCGVDLETLWFLWTWFAMLSGRPLTSTSTGWNNAFGAYYSMRRKNLKPKEAWKRLGLYCGDDGITPGIHINELRAHCKEIGLNMVGTTVSRGSLEPVEFLNRWYSPDVWVGDPASMCNVARALAKFHVCVHNTLTSKQILVAKAQAYYYSDGNTPVLGQFCEKVLALADKEIENCEFVPSHTEETQIVRNWNSRFPKHVQYPNEHEIFVDLAENALKKYAFNFELFEQHLKKCNSLTDIIAWKTICEPAEETMERPAHDVIIDGELHRGATALDISGVDDKPVRPVPACNNTHNDRFCTDPKCSAAHSIATAKVATCQDFADDKKCRFGETCAFSHCHVDKAFAHSAPQALIDVAKSKRKQ